MALSLNINGNASGLNTALASASGALRSFSARADASFGALIKGSAVFGLVQHGLAKMGAIVGSPISGLKNAFDLGGSLNDLSAQTDIAAGKLQLYQQAFKDTGIGAENVGASVNKAQKLIAAAGQGNQEAAATVAGLGLSFSDIEGLSPDKQFEALGAAIAAIQDPAQRSKAAMDVFGKSGGKMLALFRDGGALAAAAQTLGTQSEILDRQAGVFDAISDHLGNAGVKLQGFFVGVADKVAPVLLPMLERFARLDFAAWGQQIGNAVQIALAAFQDGKLGELVSLSLKIGFGSAINYLAAGIAAAVRFLGSGGLGAIVASFEALGAKLTEILLRGFAAPIRSFQAGLTFAVEQVMELFGSEMGRMIISVVKGLNPILGFAADKLSDALGIKGYKARSYDEVYEGTDANLLGRNAGDFAAQSAEAAKRAGDGFAAGIQGALQGLTIEDSQGVGAMQEQLGALVTSLQTTRDQLTTAGGKAGAGADLAQEGHRLTKGARVKEAASSLAKVGGGGYGGANLQREANSLLKQVVAGTSSIVKAVQATGTVGGAMNAQISVFAS